MLHSRSLGRAIFLCSSHLGSNEMLVEILYSVSIQFSAVYSKIAMLRADNSEVNCSNISVLIPFPYYRVEQKMFCQLWTGSSSDDGLCIDDYVSRQNKNGKIKLRRNVFEQPCGSGKLRCKGYKSHQRLCQVENLMSIHAPPI